ELKYVTVRTVSRSYILDGALNELEERYSAQFIRIHRNALVARTRIRALEKRMDATEGEVWTLRMHGVEDTLSVSRRQLTSVRALISQ
nr:LytTR family DNA-binding domain-containing protein [Rhodoferax sp.]